MPTSLLCAPASFHERPVLPSHRGSRRCRGGLSASGTRPRASLGGSRRARRRAEPLLTRASPRRRGPAVDLDVDVVAHQGDRPALAQILPLRQAADQLPRRWSRWSAGPSRAGARPARRPPRPRRRRGAPARRRRRAPGPAGCAARSCGPAAVEMSPQATQVETAPVRSWATRSGVVALGHAGAETEPLLVKEHPAQHAQGQVLEGLGRVARQHERAADVQVALDVAERQAILAPLRVHGRAPAPLLDGEREDAKAVLPVLNVGGRDRQPAVGR